MVDDVVVSEGAEGGDSSDKDVQRAVNGGK